MISVLLLDFGGPETADDVRPFLKNLFSDKNIFPFPVGQEIFANLMAKFRAPKVAAHYGKIGGGSKAPKQTLALAAEIEKSLQSANLDVRICVGMRYWKPFIDETLRQIAEAKPSGILVIPMFPHYSTATTLSVLQEFQKAYDRQKILIPYQIVEWWYDHPQFIAAWCFSIKRALDKFEEKIRQQVPILFTAHGLPESFVRERKDPYPKQIKESAEKIMTYLGGTNPSYLSYQSKVGPIEWLKPSTIEFVKELALKGTKNLILVPISFLTDHIETLYEIDLEIIPVAKQAGMEQAVCCEALIHTPYLKKALEEILLKKLPALLR